MAPYSAIPQPVSRRRNKRRKTFISPRRHEVFHRTFVLALQNTENGWDSRMKRLCLTRHSRARGNPGLICAQLAWIPAFAGMTNPGDLFIVETLTLHVFSRGHEGHEVRNLVIEPFVSYVTFVVQYSFPLGCGCAALGTFVVKMNLQTLTAGLPRPFSNLAKHRPAHKSPAPRADCAR